MATSELGIAKVFHGAQTALFAALSDGQGYSQGKAYRAAGYLAKPGASTDSAASSRLRKFKGILERVRELVAEANERNEHAIDLSRDRVGHDLDEAYRTAKEQGNASAMVASALGIAKVFHPSPIENDSAFNLKSATTMHEFGKRLLLTVGMENPDASSIEAAIEANDAFVLRLEQIASSQRTIDSLSRPMKFPPRSQPTIALSTHSSAFVTSDHDGR